MWYPCECAECFGPCGHGVGGGGPKDTWKQMDDGGFGVEPINPIIHGFLPLNGQPMGHPICYPTPQQQLAQHAHQQALIHLIRSGHLLPNRDIDSKFTGNNTQLAIKYEPDNDSDDLKKPPPEHIIQPSPQDCDKTNEDSGKKNKDYSDDSSINADSTLPPVIRRRNRNRRKKMEMASSMVDPSSGGGGWETDSATRSNNISNLRQKSQSISDDQWAQVMSSQDGGANQGWGPVPGYPDQGQQGRGTRSNTLGRSGGGLPQSRGMVSSASVCDLNTLSQQQQQQPQQPNFANPHMAGSFQHLNMMGMVPWGAPPPGPCDVCQGAPMNCYPGHQHGGGGGMRRTGSNLSMNLSSVGSNEMPGYPWPPPPHMHPHHMPIAYPGYYPGYPPHMVPPPPGSMSSSTGLNISIPDSMNTFGKVPSSPNASVRSSSHRSHKSSKSRSFSAADGRRSRSYNKKRSEESEDSYSSSYSSEEEINERVSKTGYRAGGTLSWQCDHCTFINSGGTRTCGMCSKTQGSGKKENNRSKSRNNDRSHRSESRKHGNRRTDHDDDPDISDYDNDEVLKSNFTFNIRDNRKESRSKSSASNKTKSRKKSRKSVTRSRAGSPDSSPSGSEEEVKLERQMKDLRVSSSRKQNGEYDGYNKKEKERSSHKKEGKHIRKK